MGRCVSEVVVYEVIPRRRSASYASRLQQLRRLSHKPIRRIEGYYRITVPWSGNSPVDLWMFAAQMPQIPESLIKRPPYLNWIRKPYKPSFGRGAVTCRKSAIYVVCASPLVSQFRHDKPSVVLFNRAYDLSLPVQVIETLMSNICEARIHVV